MKVLSPMTNSVLRPYLDNVRNWHGYVRYLGLPTIQDNPDTPIDSLFVAPLLAKEPVSPDTDPNNWPSGTDVFALLKESKRVTILGDPGGGKTTLLNWLSWLLVSGRLGAYPSWLDGVVPFPLVLRELDLRSVESFDDLIDAFLKRPVAQSLVGNNSLIETMFSSGKVIVLVDGFDEVHRGYQEAIRKALWEGFSRYPESYFVTTSRLVGYEDCPIDRKNIPSISVRIIKKDEECDVADSTNEDSESKVQIVISRDSGQCRQEQVSLLAYVMPFDDRRIQEFVHSWYRLRTFRQASAIDANDFLAAIFDNKTTLRLARTPQLLTLMALVFRVKAQLPDGRALLYDLISEAYLESIDLSRKIVDDKYPWREKRRWLARIGFEMQMLRTECRTNPRQAEDKELLVGRDQVLDWIQQAMEHSGYGKDVVFSDEYLSWIARRSGLLLPRGENLFAFLHLSFQEYFAALYLVDEHLADPDWVIAQRDGVSYSEGDSRVTAENIEGWAKDVRWQEVLVFCFEEFAYSYKNARRLLEWAFGKTFEKFHDRANFRDTGESESKARLLARIIIDPHSGLAEVDKLNAFNALARYTIFETLLYEDKSTSTRYELVETSALRILLSNDRFKQEFWSYADKLNIVSVDVTFLNEEVIEHSWSWKKLKSIWFFHGQSVDIAKISHCKHLITLFIAGPVPDLEPIKQLTYLRFLSIRQLRSKKIKPLLHLNRLTNLTLDVGSVDDVNELGKLQTLMNLELINLVHPNLLFLKSLDLIALELTRCNIDDLNAILAFERLSSLALNWMVIKELTAISSLTNIKKLKLCGIEGLDLTPLAGLHELEQLDLSHSQVKDLKPLLRLNKLKKLNITGSKIDDSSALDHLAGVEIIGRGTSQGPS